ncbi:hypothetical protein Tco_1073429 [Tanacetum coccineum]
MANEPNEVRDAILRQLRTEQEKEVTLVNNLLSKMTRYLLQKLSRAEEKTRVRSLPLDQPLNSYSLHTLLMTSESDRRITTALEATRKEVMRSIDEKREIINNYRESKSSCSRILCHAMIPFALNIATQSANILSQPVDNMSNLSTRVCRK